MGKHWWIVLIFAAALVVPRSANAQVSVWLQNGVSGLGAEAGVSADDSSTTVHVAGGYSHLGQLDFDVGLNYTTFNNDNAIASDLGAYGATVAVQYHPLKQGPDMPISLALQLGVPFGMLTSQQLDDAGISGTLWGIAGGVAAYRFIKIAPNVGVTPSIGLLYTYSHITLKNDMDEQVTSSDGQIGLNLTGNFGFLASNGAIYGISPSLFLGDNVSYSLTVGIIWTLH